jgi:hypothetical protein
MEVLPMAAAILSTHSLVSQSLVEDLIIEVAPSMELAKAKSFNRIYTVLQASVDCVAAAYRDLASLPAVIAAERRRVAAAGNVCLSAFELFLTNLDNGD